MKTAVRRLICFAGIFVAMGILTACQDKKETGQNLKEGIGPYELSQREEDLLEALGMAQDVQILWFQVPKGTKSVMVHAYSMKDGSSWEQEDIGGVSLVSGDGGKEELSGLITMSLKDNYSIDISVTANGARYSATTDEIPLDKEIIGSSKGFMTSSQSIETGQEIPVAIMVYDSGTRMESYTLEDYFSPSKFQGMDFVQAVTVSFLSQ